MKMKSDAMGNLKQITDFVMSMVNEAKEKKGEAPKVDDNRLIEHLNAFSEQAKDIIEHENQLLPIAVFVSKWDALRIMGMMFDGYDSKAKAFTMAGNLAALGHAAGCMAGLITVIDAHYKYVESDEEMEKYQQGDLAKDPKSKDMVLLTLTRPNHKPFTIMQGYSKADDGTVKWDEPTMFDGDLATEKTRMVDNLMPDWTNLERVFATEQGENVIASMSKVLSETVPGE